MYVARIGKGVLVAATLSVVGGCQSVGPIEIGLGRDRYNSVLQSTGKVQTLANLVRVKYRDETSFMDVTEVDAGTSVSGTLTGAVTNIGARAGTSGGTLAGEVGSITPGVNYSEAPFIRYIPLVGQGLVSQLVTPVGVDALESLYNSGWSTAVILDLASSYLAPDFRDNGAAVNIISLLADDYLTATLVAGKSDLTPEQSSTANQARAQSNAGGGGSNNASKPPADDALTIFLQPANPGASPFINRETLRWWRQLLAIYHGTQPNSDGRSIEFRTVAVKAAQAKKEPGLETRAPMLKTYSALGIVQNAIQDTGSIEFASPERAREIRDYEWNKHDLGFYTLPAARENLKGLSLVAQQTREGEELIQRLARWIDESPQLPDKQQRIDRLYLYAPNNHANVNDPIFINGNAALLALRRYILIVCDDAAPPDAYVAYFHEGKWYYIAGNDETSKKNFNLIALFLTVMAVPSSTAPVGTTISVGGGG